MAEYWRCPDDVSAIAGELIETYHQHLERAGILFLFRDEASSSNGKLVAGKASKMTAKENAIAGGAAYDFKIELAFDLWEKGNEKWRRALIDHELCHCGGTREEGWSILAHDIEEFAQIVERHGTWNKDLDLFMARTNQLDLFTAQQADPSTNGKEQEKTEPATDEESPPSAASGGLPAIIYGDEPPAPQDTDKRLIYYEAVCEDLELMVVDPERYAKPEEIPEMAAEVLEQFRSWRDTYHPSLSGEEYTRTQKISERLVALKTDTVPAEAVADLASAEEA